jgi:hypothetical protein
VIPKGKNPSKMVLNDLQKQLRVNLLSNNEKSPCYGNLDEDLDIAMNMSDSFTCSVLNKNEEKYSNVKCVVNEYDTAENNKRNCDKSKPILNNTIGQTSLTLSMLQRELDSEMYSQIDFGDIGSTCNMKIVSSKTSETTIQVVEQCILVQKSTGGQSMEFSPEMTAILDAFCDNMTPVKPLGKKAPKQASKTNVCHQGSKSELTPPKPSIVSRRKGKKRGSIEKKSDIKNSKSRKSNDLLSPSLSDSHNESAASDCVPPTPPRDDDLSRSKVSTPQRLLGGVVCTPQKGHRKNKNSQRVTPQSERVMRSTPRSDRVTQTRHKPEACVSLVANISATPKSKSCTAQSTATTQALAPNRLLQSPTVSQTMPSSLPFTNQSFTIIDVATNKMLFDRFIEEWSTKSVYAFCVACEKIPLQPAEGPVIGGNFKKGNFYTHIKVFGALKSVPLKWQECMLWEDSKGCKMPK